MGPSTGAQGFRLQINGGVLYLSFTSPFYFSVLVTDNGCYVNNMWYQYVSFYRHVYQLVFAICELYMVFCSNIINRLPVAIEYIILYCLLWHVIRSRILVMYLFSIPLRFALSRFARLLLVCTWSASLRAIALRYAHMFCWLLPLIHNGVSIPHILLIPCLTFLLFNGSLTLDTHVYQVSASYMVDSYTMAFLLSISWSFQSTYFPNIKS